MDESEVLEITHGARIALINALAQLPYSEAYELIPYLSNLEPQKAEETQPKIIVE